jgi:hypothetical protein
MSVGIRRRRLTIFALKTKWTKLSTTIPQKKKKLKPTGFKNKNKKFGGHTNLSILLLEVGGTSKWAVLRQRRTSEGGALRSIFKLG